MFLIVNVIHISDLHYGSKEFQKDLLLNVVDYINEKMPDVVVCTGDFTHKGKISEYEKISTFLKEIKPPLLAIPGNHDARNNGLIFFERFFNPRRKKLILDEKDTIIIGLCSAKDDISEGELGDDQMVKTIKVIQQNQKMNRIIALHHHLVAVPYSGRQRNTLIDAGEALEVIRLLKIDICLMGHKHVPHVWRIGPTTLIYCGTSCSEKVRADEAPCFNDITLNDNNLTVHVVNSKTLQRSLLIKRVKGHTDFLKHRLNRLEHLFKSELSDDLF